MYQGFCLLKATEEQPIPKGAGADIATLVHADIEARVEYGVTRYGERLTSHNGRDALADAYQEALDLVMYLRQVLYERDERDVSVKPPPCAHSVVTKISRMHDSQAGWTTRCRCKTCGEEFTVFEERERLVDRGEGETFERFCTGVHTYGIDLPHHH